LSPCHDPFDVAFIGAGHSFVTFAAATVAFTAAAIVERERGTMEGERMREKRIKLGLSLFLSLSLYVPPMSMRLYKKGWRREALFSYN
jgi:hypothetical protein